MNALSELTEVVGVCCRFGWVYDRAGRLVTEIIGDQERSFEYDGAGQLVIVTGADGTSTRYEYDGQGCRTLAVAGAQRTEYGWDGRGWLTQVTSHDVDGVRREVGLWVNALDELAGVDGMAIDRDLVAGMLSVFGDLLPLVLGLVPWPISRTRYGVLWLAVGD